MFNPPPVMDSYFRAAIKLLQSHNIPTVYATMPINYSTFVRTKPGVVQSYHSYVSQLSNSIQLSVMENRALLPGRIGSQRALTRMEPQLRAALRQAAIPVGFDKSGCP